MSKKAVTPPVEDFEDLELEADLEVDPFAERPPVDPFAGVHTVVEPDGTEMTVEEARSGVQPARHVAPSTSPGAAPAANDDERVRSPFRHSPHFVAGTCKILGTIFEYREMDDRLQEWTERRYAQIAKRLGITVEQLANDDYKKANKAELAKLPDYMEQAFTYVLERVIVGWQDPEIEFDPKHLRTLGREHKTALFWAVKRSTEMGIGQDFFSKAP